MIDKHNLSFGFLANPVFQRWSIGFSLCLILAFILAPEIHFSIPKYKSGTISYQDIKADRDFLVEDHESTKQKKMMPRENIKSFMIMTAMLLPISRTKLIKSFNAVELYYQNISEKNQSEYSSINIHETQKAKKLFESNLGFSISPEEFYILQDHKFSHELQQRLSRLIISFYESRFITNAVFQNLKKKRD